MLAVAGLAEGVDLTGGVQTVSTGGDRRAAATFVRLENGIPTTSRAWWR